MDPNALKQLLVAEGTRWVLEQHGRARVAGRPLAATERATFEPYLRGFPALDDVRVAIVSRIENPAFLRQLPEDVRVLMIDFSAMDAVTFQDAIVATRAVEADSQRWVPTLLHELVHVAQYAILGVDGFVREYVDGLVEHDYVYDRNPLEVMAYALQRRFELGEVFSVATEVWRELAAAR